MEQNTLIQMLSKPVKEVIAYSQNLAHNGWLREWKIDNLLNQWYRAKEPFIKSLTKISGATGVTEDNPTLIYEFPGEVSFELDDDCRASKLKGFIEFVSDYCWESGDITDVQTASLCEFIHLNEESFLENKVTVPFVGTDGTQINTGIKIIKAFKFFLKQPHLEKIQNVASTLIQENKITGHFCVSVHPLDFLSASETTYNWRSCHSLDGDYRAGNMAYMVDGATVMCYLKGNNDEILPRFPESVPWNSKKWRMLLFFNQDKDVFAAGRQYPFEAKSLLEFVRANVIPIFTGISFRHSYRYTANGLYIENYSKWDDASIDSIMSPDTYPKPYQLNDTYINIRGNLYPKRKIIHSNNDLFYNDLLNSTKYIPSFCNTMPNREIEGVVSPFKIGGRPFCPICGRNTIQSSEEMMCVDCDIAYGTQENEMVVACASCGERIAREEAYEEDGEFYCRCCAPEEEDY